MIITTLVYCVKSGETLLLKRRKPPFVGMWVAPGGKVERGESPHECARRELEEETGLRAEHLDLRGVVVETSPRDDWQWLLFIYVTTEFSGILTGDGSELSWWPIEGLSDAPLPESDKIFGRRVLQPEQPLYEARYEYDAELRLVRVHEHRTATGKRQW